MEINLLYLIPAFLGGGWVGFAVAMFLVSAKDEDDFRGDEE